MTFKTQSGIGGTHPFTIINNLNQRFTSIFNNEFNSSCIGINGIFK